MPLLTDLLVPTLLVAVSLLALLGMLASLELLATLLRPLRLAPLLRALGQAAAAWAAFGLLLAALFALHR